MWIAFRGVLGRIFVSPAYHQVHHSSNPKHFNKNFGSCLALWDWMFGTLYVPEKEREPLTFGFPDQPNAHTVKGELVDPFGNTAGHLKPLWQKRPADMPGVPVAERKQA
jgi:sterol desaturase/sphingolipid hydroxylase (fatty acid hydroxylase superfamily)